MVFLLEITMSRWIRRFVIALSICVFVSSVISTLSSAFAKNVKGVTAAYEAKDAKDLTYFLTMSDIHFDPFIACYGPKKRPCPLIQELRKAPASAWSAILSKTDKASPQYRQDTNYTLLTSGLAAAKKAAAEKEVRFVLALGDFLGHDYRNLYKKYSGDASRGGFESFARKTMQFIANELEQTFPAISVYPVIGNNDSYHRDYISDPNGAFFHDTQKAWSQLIKDKNNRAQMQKTFGFGGYYSVIAEPGLRLVMLNTVLFSTKARGKATEAAAEQELNWLHQELQKAKEQNQRVIIAMHIPVGIDVYASLRIHLFRLIELWKTKYSDRYQAELKQFAPQIAGIFAGHLHSDWFQILTFKDSKDEIPVTGTPSISPIFGNNPGFKIYSYSSDTFELDDFVTYYYPINEHKPWRVEYDFNRIFQPNCQDCPIIHSMKLLKQTGNLSEQYKLFYAVSTHSQPIKEKWSPYYWCAIHDINASDYQRCLG